MARRRDPEAAPTGRGPRVPARLARCIVADWLPDDYQAPAYLPNGADARLDDEAIAAWAVWRRARADFGARHRLTPAELGDLIPMRAPVRHQHPSRSTTRRTEPMTEKTAQAPQTIRTVTP